MNDANVKAIASMILEATESVPLGVRAGPIADGMKAKDAREDAEKWARFFAARGVLVPSAITDEQAHDVRPGVFGLKGENYETHAAWVRSALERIAKGEQETER